MCDSGVILLEGKHCEQWNKHLMSKNPSPEVDLTLLLSACPLTLGKALYSSGPQILLSLTCCFGFSFLNIL